MRQVRRHHAPRPDAPQAWRAAGSLVQGVQGRQAAQGHSQEEEVHVVDLKAYARKRIDRKWFTLTAFIWGILAGLVLSGWLTTNAAHIEHLLVGCDGIDEFYNQTQVYNATRDFFVGADHIRSMSIGLMDDADKGINTPAKLPRAILDREQIDCDTVSNAIYCLSLRYENITCRFYTINVNNPTPLPLYGHQGIACTEDVSDDDAWRLMY